MANEASAKGEVLIRIIPEHWMKYVLPVTIYVLLLVMSILLFLLAGVVAHHYDWLAHVSFLAALGVFLADHHWFFWTLMSESESHIIITSKRVIRMQERLFLQEGLVEISFERMKTVEAEKNGFLQNILNYGTLRFEGKSPVPYVPHPHGTARDIEQAMGMR